VTLADARRDQRRSASAAAAGIEAACLRRQTAPRKDRGIFLAQAPNLVAGRVFLIESAPFAAEVTGRGAIATLQPVLAKRQAGETIYRAWPRV
jgi:hypothetical protein